MVRVWIDLTLASQRGTLAEALQAREFQVVDHPLAAQVGLVKTGWEVPPPLPSLVLLRSREQAAEALKLGHKGYLYPEQGLEVLAQALRKVAEGEVWAERRGAHPATFPSGKGGGSSGGASWPISGFSPRLSGSLVVVLFLPVN